MGHKNILLCSATVIALTGAVVTTPGLGQTQTAPAQNAPAQRTVEQVAPLQNAMPPSSSTEMSTAASPQPVHHTRRHHVQTAASRSERLATKRFNEQQLGQARFAAQPAQTAQLAQFQPQVAQRQSPDQSQRETAMAASGGPTATPAGAVAGASPQANAATMPANSTATISEQASIAASPSPAEAVPAQNAGTGTAKIQSETATASSGQTARNTASSSAGTTPSPGATPNAPEAAAADAMPLNQVHNAERTLANAKVQGSAGQPIGTVTEVSSDTSGAPAKVQVKLDQAIGSGKKSVWINADQVQYRPQDNSLITTLTPEQLNAM